MRVAVTGGSGLIGSALIRHLVAEGHDVVRLVRRTPSAPGEVRWDPQGGEVDLAGLAGVEAVVHLAGAGAGDKRWTEAYKRTIRDSRVLGTRTLVRALSSLDPPPHTLVSGSAIGGYGDRGEEVLTEDSPTRPSAGFLPAVVRDWEAEAMAAAAAGIRVVTPRTGLVMSPSGGAFDRLLTFIRLGIGGPLGSGRQWWSWVSLEDEVAALTYLLQSDLSGPVNLTAPEPARNADVIRAIGRAAHRPTLLPAPAFALRIVLGEFAEEVLGSVRVLPARLTASGFGFRHQTLPEAAEWLVR